MTVALYKAINCSQICLIQYCICRVSWLVSSRVSESARLFLHPPAPTGVCRFEL